MSQYKGEIVLYSSSTKNSFSFYFFEIITYILHEYVVGIFSKLLYYLPEISQSDKGSDQIGDLST